MFSNRTALECTDDGLRRDALAILESAVQAVRVEAAVRSRLSFRATDGALLVDDRVCATLGKNGRLFVVGGGKAALAMARGAEAVLGDRIAGGVMVGVDEIDKNNNNNNNNEMNNESNTSETNNNRRKLFVLFFCF